MKLKYLREHYYSPDKGVNWFPKRSFNSVVVAIASGFDPDEWYVYNCRLCDKYHVAKLEKRKTRTIRYVS
jgi:hypothetical protein